MADDESLRPVITQDMVRAGVEVLRRSGLLVSPTPADPTLVADILRAVFHVAERRRKAIEADHL